ncbi:acetyl-CoA carboxylase biotin carboxyl carrier protein [Ruficoccus sp. ZRK36]|uniref:acetyl-CoA carboxylase biotin carboxyl carrier protein n=1 Tax=Ruficoccus sp. ZRK36 TaxID=2866311 RepID=UPI001C73D37D|nr:acetyl-CoA carboxylase biotin carboxyl carrier protein [Ruficoccus sp. ZRK36]QYY36805.1 acetyl-CoA carboxylase biotin carboxyl carrier protein [Ruficoccus sp. ZRK36]
MDLKEIKQVVELMKRSDLTEFEIEEKDLKLRICRESQKPVAVAAAPVMAPAAPAPAAAPAAPAAPAKPVEEPGTEFIKSPMVGTFYRAPSPDSPSFVEIGAVVKADSVVCIIEAMKVMNEIHAEAKGKILEVLVENGQSVEYGQPLFKIKAS